MTPVELQNALESFLKESIKDIKVKYVDANGEESLHTPSVITAWILPQEQTKESAESKNEYSYVVPRITKINGSSKEATVEVKITIGVQSYEQLNERGCAGYIDILNIMERIKQDLLKARVLDKKFLIDDTIDCQIPDEQPYPYWNGEMKITGRLPGTVEEGVNI